MEKNLAILFGGRSSEHEISRLSAGYILSICRRLPAWKIKLVGIGRDGKFYEYSGPDESILSNEWEQDRHNIELAFMPGAQPGYFLVEEGKILRFQPIDCVFPVLHGRNGEDGRLQGMLDLLGIPYVGCGTLSSAAMMDKDVARQLFNKASVPTPVWFTLLRSEWKGDKEYIFKRMRELNLSYPLFVKPANAGSSVGVSKVKSDQDLDQALKLAFDEDEKVLVEEGIEGREIECSVLQLDQGGKLFVAPPGEIIPGKEFYDYEDKYDSKSQSQLVIPAKLSEDEIKEVCTLAERAFRAGECRGLARVDFFLREKEGQFLLNEINTMPGFTRISMFPKLLLQAGFGESEMINRLLSSAR